MKALLILIKAFLILLAIPTFLLAMVLAWPLALLIVFVAILNVIIAGRKNRDEETWLALGVLLPPSLFILVALAPLARQDPAQSHCPACAEPIRAAALRCRHCGAEIAQWREHKLLADIENDLARDSRQG